MTSSERNLAAPEMLLDRDFYAKRDELMDHAAAYVSTMHLWTREFFADMTELGYKLEYTEALTIIEEAWRIPDRLKTAEENAEEAARYEEQEQQFAAEQARNGQEERI